MNAAVGVTAIPSADRLLKTDAAIRLEKMVGRTRLRDVLRTVLDHIREQALQHGLQAGDITPETVFRQVETLLHEQNESRLKAVFNLTGTVLHTNLGRTVLPEEAVQAVVQAMRQPVNLEYDLATGNRGDRDDLVQNLLCELTGAEAVTVVNNNAAAVLLMLNTLAMDREVIVSRGELVEIGGSFRIPDVMQRAGARLIEVGTTNRTHAGDYEQAVNEQSALLLKVHCSNYVIKGFTESVSMAGVAEIAHARGLPAAMDMGSGTLVDLTRWGLPREDTVSDILQAGADVATFSADKLLGGPQAGLIAGSRELLQEITRNPLKRALRVDKMRLAALEAVLQIYRSPELLPQRLTTYRLLTRHPDEMRQQAERLLPAVQQAAGADYRVASVAMRSQIGSGALPVDELPSHGLVIRYARSGRPGRALLALEDALRSLPRPVIGRIMQDALWLDFRCLDACDEPDFQAQLRPLRP